MWLYFVSIRFYQVAKEQLNQVITDSGEKVFSELCSDVSEIDHETASKWSSLFRICFRPCFILVYEALMQCMYTHMQIHGTRYRQ